ncbi:hypothetical protein [Streptomyces sp. NPDC019208]|uniref:Rv1733c family protein n=1 Tax=Streptomyces sp. NPDC019208 TaxID=3154683 RepID=UPI0033C49EFB
MAGSIPQAQPPPAGRRLPLWRWRRNPLRRTTDLLQGWIGLCLVLAVVATAPAAMRAAGGTAHRHYERIAHEQARVRHHIPAVLVHDVPRHPEPGSAEARETLYPAQVRFTDPEGNPRTAETDVAPGLPAHSTVQIWTDADGTLADPPLAPGRIRSHSMGWAALARSSSSRPAPPRTDWPASRCSGATSRRGTGHGPRRVPAGPRPSTERAVHGPRTVRGPGQSEPRTVTGPGRARGPGARPLSE